METIHIPFIEKGLIFLLLTFLLLSFSSCGPKRMESSSGDGYAADSAKTDEGPPSASKDTHHIDKGNIPKYPDKKLKPVLKQIKILYGTDRRVSYLQGNKVNYLNELDIMAIKYNVGYTIVTIPPTHVAGIIERPSLWKLEVRENPFKHMVQKVTVKLSDKTFDAIMKNVSNGSEAFIFVHGYNNTFQEAALRTAQITEDIGLPIVPILFSWSSNGNSLQYMGDSENVRMAIPAFKDFLKRVAARGNFKKIHIISHSMGNRLVTAALYELRDDPFKLKLDQIIMAAPDLYAEEFRRDLAPQMVKRSKRITVYAAKNDWALSSSNILHSHMRLGQVGLPPFVVKEVDIIDAQNVKTDFLGHGRFSESEAIMKDINMLLLTGKDPISRGVPHENYGRDIYYFFKKWKYN